MVSWPWCIVIDPYRHAQVPLVFMNWKLAFPTLLATIAVGKKGKNEEHHWVAFEVDVSMFPYCMVWHYNNSKANDSLESARSFCNSIKHLCLYLPLCSCSTQLQHNAMKRHSRGFGERQRSAKGATENCFLVIKLSHEVSSLTEKYSVHSLRRQ